VNTSFRAQLECLDRQLGILLAALPPRTIVFVLGDNGTSPGILRPQLGEPRYPIGHPLHRAGDESAQLYTYPYPPARSKGHVYEGGVHVPLLVWGPGVVAGVRSDLVDAVDLFATLAELRATQVPSGTAQDSVSFAAVLAGGSGSRAFSFSERFEPNGAGQFRTREDRSYIRSAGAHLWKVIRRLGFPDEFYDVASDPLETVDLGTSHPEYQATADALAALLAS